MSAPGDPALPTLGADIDMRSDVPRYRVFRNGTLVEEPTDIGHLWRGDLMTFILGCSFSFEWALLEGGLTMHHMTLRQERADVQNQCADDVRRTVPRPASGVDALVQTGRCDRARCRSPRAFPTCTARPVHLGLPEQIGVRDLAKPDWGDVIDVPADELPLFWACGVTPQAVVAEAKPAFCITHAPGSMLVTDLKNSQLAVF